MPPHVKYWIKPDIENRIKNGEIKAYFSTQVVEITPDAVTVEAPAGREMLPNDFVFAMTGYHPDFAFLERLGVRFEGQDRLPVCNAETLESNVPGIYLAGVIVAGSRTNEIFIENGRFHGRQIAATLVAKMKPRVEARAPLTKRSDRLGHCFPGGRSFACAGGREPFDGRCLPVSCCWRRFRSACLRLCWSASRQRALTRATGGLPYEADSLALQASEALEQTARMDRPLGEDDERRARGRPGQGD